MLALVRSMTSAQSLAALHAARPDRWRACARRGVLLAAAVALAGCSGLPLLSPPPQDGGQQPGTPAGVELGGQVPAPAETGTEAGAGQDDVAEKLAFRAELKGADAVPSTPSNGRGVLVAVLDRQTGQFRWKLQVEGLSGSVRRAGFHSPGMDGEVAPLVLSLGAVQDGRAEGQAQLTPRQQGNLLSGQWYVNLPTAQYPDGELRGALIEQR